MNQLCVIFQQTPKPRIVFRSSRDFRCIKRVKILLHVLEHLSQFTPPVLHKHHRFLHSFGRFDDDIYRLNNEYKQCEFFVFARECLRRVLYHRVPSSLKRNLLVCHFSLSLLLPSSRIWRTKTIQKTFRRRIILVVKITFLRRFSPFPFPSIRLSIVVIRGGVVLRTPRKSGGVGLALPPLSQPKMVMKNAPPPYVSFVKKRTR